MSIYTIFFFLSFIFHFNIIIFGVLCCFVRVSLFSVSLFTNIRFAVNFSLLLLLLAVFDFFVNYCIGQRNFCVRLPFIAISNATYRLFLFFFVSFRCSLLLLFNLITMVGMYDDDVVNMLHIQTHRSCAVCLDNLVIRSVLRRRWQWCCNLSLVYKKKNEFTRNYYSHSTPLHCEMCTIYNLNVYSILVSLQILSMLKWRKSEQFIHVFWPLTSDNHRAVEFFWINSANTTTTTTTITINRQQNLNKNHTKKKKR